MKNLALSKTEAKDKADCSPCDGDLPRYPYGLCLYLDDETLKKLGITELPKVGSNVQFGAVAKVTSTSQRAYQTSEGKEEMRTCIDLQITDMDVPAPALDMATAAKTLYSK